LLDFLFLVFFSLCQVGVSYAVAAAVLVVVHQNVVKKIKINNIQNANYIGHQLH
jgi:hypothetical protein